MGFLYDKFVNISTVTSVTEYVPLLESIWLID